MRALHRASEGQKVVLLNDSERSLNFLFICLFFFFFNFCIELVVDINSTYQYTKTFHLIDTTIKNIAINVFGIGRHSVLSQSEIDCTVAIEPV